MAMRLHVDDATAKRAASMRGSGGREGGCDGRGGTNGGSGGWEGDGGGAGGAGGRGGWAGGRGGCVQDAQPSQRKCQAVHLQFSARAAQTLS